MNNQQSTQVVTNKSRLSYVHLFKPYAYMPGQEEKYSCTILVPKTDVATKQAIDNAIAVATERGIKDRLNGVKPPVLAIPVYDGDGVRPSDGMPFGEECKGHWVFTASAKADYPPQVVDQSVQPILNQTEVYSGMYANVCVNFYPYAFGGKKGIGVGLGPVQKVADGEPLGGTSASASSVFSAISQPNTSVNPQQNYMQAQQGYAQANPQPQIDPITGQPIAPMMGL